MTKQDMVNEIYTKISHEWDSEQLIQWIIAEINGKDEESVRQEYEEIVNGD